MQIGKKPPYPTNHRLGWLWVQNFHKSEQNFLEMSKPLSSNFSLSLDWPQKFTTTDRMVYVVRTYSIAIFYWVPNYILGTEYVSTEIPEK